MRGNIYLLGRASPSARSAAEQPVKPCADLPLGPEDRRIAGLDRAPDERELFMVLGFLRPETSMCGRFQGLSLFSSGTRTINVLAKTTSPAHLKT